MHTSMLFRDRLFTCRKEMRQISFHVKPLVFFYNNNEKHLFVHEYRVCSPFVTKRSMVSSQDARLFSSWFSKQGHFSNHDSNCLPREGAVLKTGAKVN
jgi:hypothetical protein